MAPFIRVNSRMALDTAMVSRYGLTVPNMKYTGETMLTVEEESSIILMEMFTMVTFIFIFI